MANREPTPGQRWFKRSVQLALVGGAAAVLWFAWPETEVEVRTTPVQRGTVEDIVPSLQAGSVKSHRQVALRSVSIGQVKALAVQRGDRVKEGQLLVELENTSLQARLRLARANLATGESASRTAALRLDLARRLLERNRQLTEKGVLASQALERTQAEFDMAREATVTAESGLAEIRATVEVAQAALADTRVLAPFDGLVVAVHIEKGESLMVGAPVLDIVDDSHVTVEATVDEADAGRLKQEMPVRVQTDAFPDHSFDGRLTWISPVVAQDLRQNRHLDIEVSLNGDAALLKVGMSTDVEVIVNRKEATLYVPTNAIMRKGERQQVYVILAGRARLRDLRVGLSNWERSEVLEGLREGEAVVISLGEKGLKDGVKVRAPGADGRMAQ